MNLLTGQDIPSVLLAAVVFGAYALFTGAIVCAVTLRTTPRKLRILAGACAGLLLAGEATTDLVPALQPSSVQDNPLLVWTQLPLLAGVACALPYAFRYLARGGHSRVLASLCALASLVVAVGWLTAHPMATGPFGTAVRYAFTLQLLSCATVLGTVTVLIWLRERPAALRNPLVGCTGLFVLASCVANLPFPGGTWTFISTDYSLFAILGCAVAFLATAAGVLWLSAHERETRRALGAAVLGGAVVAALGVGTSVGARTTPAVFADSPVERVLEYNPALGGLCSLHGRGRLAVTLEKARTGGTGVRAIATGGDLTTVTDLQGVRVSFTPPDGGAPLAVDLVRRDGGAWSADEVDLPVPGMWQVNAGVGMSDVYVPTGTALLPVL
ncbi:hypothetical protein [Streptomyces sp. NPDC002537]